MLQRSENDRSRSPSVEDMGISQNSPYRFPE